MTQARWCNDVPGWASLRWRLRPQVNLGQPSEAAMGTLTSFRQRDMKIGLGDLLMTKGLVLETAEGCNMKEERSWFTMTSALRWATADTPYFSSSNMCTRTSCKSATVRSYIKAYKPIVSFIVSTYDFQSQPRFLRWWRRLHGAQAWQTQLKCTWFQAWQTFTSRFLTYRTRAR